MLVRSLIVQANTFLLSETFEEQGFGIPKTSGQNPLQPGLCLENTVLG